MPTSNLGACEWFVFDLRRSNLVPPEQLEPVIEEFLRKNSLARPPDLAAFLIERKILTEFQAERLLRGKGQGHVLGPYTLMDTLGAGSLGTVFKAQAKTDGNWYAVKVLPRRSMWNVLVARRKLRLFEQRQHPAVVPFVDVGTSGGTHYLVWPLVEGKTLDKVVEEQGRLPAERAARYALDTAEGLDFYQQHKLFHGLLKPSNLMVSPDGTIKVLDIGIGSLLAEPDGESLVDTMSTANAFSSELDCASPESILDPTNLSALGDQYSLGCILYYCLSGRYPFSDGNTGTKILAHQHKQPPPLREMNPDVPAPLAAVVERLMQKSPADRFPDWKAVAQALRPLAGASEATRPAPAAAPQPAPVPAVPVAPVRPTPVAASPSPPQPEAPKSDSPVQQPVGKRPWFSFWDENSDGPSNATLVLTTLFFLVVGLLLYFFGGRPRP
jgi:serine/threonine-protein kinase